MGKEKIRWPYDDIEPSAKAVERVSSLVSLPISSVESLPENIGCSGEFLVVETEFLNASEILAASLEIYDFYSKRYVEELKKIKYAEYLKSPHWKTVRSRAIKDAMNRCQVCNAGPPLHVHHRTYVRRGEEQPEDVTVLCAGCHSEFHKTGKLKAED